MQTNRASKKRKAPPTAVNQNPSVAIRQPQPQAQVTNSRWEEVFKQAVREMHGQLEGMYQDPEFISNHHNRDVLDSIIGTLDSIRNLATQVQFPEKEKTFKSALSLLIYQQIAERIPSKNKKEAMKNRILNIAINIPEAAELVKLIGQEDKKLSDEQNKKLDAVRDTQLSSDALSVKAAIETIGLRQYKQEYKVVFDHVLNEKLPEFDRIAQNIVFSNKDIFLPQALTALVYGELYNKLDQNNTIDQQYRSLFHKNIQDLFSSDQNIKDLAIIINQERLQQQHQSAQDSDFSSTPLSAAAKGSKTEQTIASFSISSNSSAPISAEQLKTLDEIEQYTEGLNDLLLKDFNLHIPQSLDGLKNKLHKCFTDILPSIEHYEKQSGALDMIHGYTARLKDFKEILKNNNLGAETYEYYAACTVDLLKEALKEFQSKPSARPSSPGQDAIILDNLLT